LCGISRALLPCDPIGALSPTGELILISRLMATPQQYLELARARSKGAFPDGCGPRALRERGSAEVYSGAIPRRECLWDRTVKHAQLFSLGSVVHSLLRSLH